MVAAICDGEESSLLEWNEGQLGSQHTMMLTCFHPAFPNLPP